MTASTNNKSTLPGETLQSLFSLAVQKHGGNTFIISDADGSVFTYADAAQVVRRIMAALAAEGAKKGDRICTIAPARPEVNLLFLAAMNLGLIVVPLDFAMPDKALERILGKVEPTLIFVEHRNLNQLVGAANVPRTIVFDGPEEAVVPGTSIFSEWLGLSDGEAAAVEVLPQDDALIIFTSGTTGDPKGVLLAHRALFHRAHATAELYRLTSADVFLNQSDMHVVMGPVAILTMLAAGSALLLTPTARRANALAIAECIRQYRCTKFFTVPMTLRQFIQFSDRIEPEDLSSLKQIVCAGGILPQELVTAFHDRFRIPALNGYGTTEIGWGTSQTHETFLSSDGSIGLPFGTIEVVDEDGAVLAQGAIGELRVKNEFLMKGYYLDPALTATVLRGGWYYTGDLGSIRSDGHVILKGRKKHFIKHGNGELIWLEEVEVALERHPGVSEAAVCGFTSKRGDERLAAFVVPKGPPTDSAAFFKDIRSHLQKELASYKVPALFFLKDRLPRTNMGKVLRESLKKEIVEP